MSYVCTSPSPSTALPTASASLSETALSKLICSLLYINLSKYMINLTIMFLLPYGNVLNTLPEHELQLPPSMALIFVAEIVRCSPMFRTILIYYSNLT
ncbi:expressed protein [Echinococcus multilocularis]|uniref:Expressed protein n=1 Tax=Echinococcus multilocularis TaxID=6211 RepID=A0A068XV99_ECHMU|nr:expressed protein [Echinococcus multilocularis]